MDVKLTQSPDAFDLPEWRALLAADPHRHIFSTPEWNRAWWEEFGGGKELFVLTFLDPGPVGLAALILDQTPEGGRLRFLGGDDLTDYLGPLSAEHEHLPAIAEALVGYARDDIPGWATFDAKCLPVPFHFAEWLVVAADRLGLEFRIDQPEMTLVLELPSSFDEYLEALGRRERHELRRKLRRFEREAPEASVATATGETLEADLEVFAGMHRGSEGLKGKFMAPERATFFARVARLFQPLGMLSLDFLEVGGRRIASTFSYDFNQTFYLYNSAYDHGLGSLSPGLMLATGLIRRSIERGYRLFDLLRGQERYKFELGGVPLPLHTVTIYSKGPPPGAAL